MMDTSEINSGFVDRTAGAEEPPIKHSKLYVFTALPLLVNV